MRVCSTLLSLVGGLGLVHASELHPIDFRVVLMQAPETEKVDMTYRSGNFGVSGETNSIDAGWRFEAGLVTRIAQISPRWSLVGGGWFFFSDQDTNEVAPGSRELSVMTGPMEYTTLGVDLYAAINLNLNQYLDVEFGPFVGIGSARYSDAGVEAGNPNGRVSYTGHGDYEEAGLNLAVMVRTSDHSVLVGLGMRYLVSYGEAENYYDTADAQGNRVVHGLKQYVEIRQRAFAPYMNVGLSF
jgi:hypothetical protein